jgi:hypothetical protein
MKTNKSIGGFVSAIATNFLLATVFFIVVNQFVEVNVYAASIATVAFGIAISAYAQLTGKSKSSNFAFMALQQEIWVPFIQENLFPSNSVLSLAKDHSQFIEYKTVHLPQAGSIPGIVKNNLNVPLSVGARPDTDFTYQIDNYKLTPRVVTGLEELQLSYPKLQDVMGEYFTSAGYGLCNLALVNWCPAGATSQVRMTGSAVATALAPGATGTRNSITLADFATAKAMMDKQFIPAEGRYAIVDPDVYAQILAINNIQAFYAYNMPVTQTGNVPKLFGFEIIQRPLTPIFDNSGTPVVKSVITDTTVFADTDNTNRYSFGTPVTPATTDNKSILCFHKDFISKAMQPLKLRLNVDRAEYFGDLVSGELQFGASLLRGDSKGVVSIIQQ